MYELITHALVRPTTCSELFQLAVVIFKSARESGSAALDLSTTIQRLSKLLLGHKPHEVGILALVFSERLSDNPYPPQDIIQPGAIDLAAHGLVNLLHCMLCDTNDQARSEILASE